MKSMKDKKKSLMKDHILDSNKQYILPPGYRGACHLHKEILLFKTIDDLTKHNRERHDFRMVQKLD